MTPHINKRYSKLRTSIMAPPVNGPNAKATHNAISDIWNTISTSKTDVEFQSDLRQIQFHTLEYVWCPPVYPSMIKHQRQLERTLFQAPYMDQITFEFLKIIFIEPFFIIDHESWPIIHRVLKKYCKNFLEHSTEIWTVAKWHNNHADCR